MFKLSIIIRKDVVYMKKLVSIIMPAYNARDTIEESVESVLAQSYDNWELLIVNDCSTDDTADIMSRYANHDSRIKLINQEKNGGVAAARNTAIEASKGDYIAFLDSDDLWDPKKLEKQVTFMNGSKYAMSCTGYEVIDVNSISLGKLVIPPNSISFKNLLKGSRIGCLTVMINLDVVLKRDIFMKDTGHEDYITWLNVANEYGDIGCIKEVLAQYRVFEGSLSGNKWKAINWQYKIYRDEFGFGLIRSFYYMGNYGINSFVKYRRKKY